MSNLSNASRMKASSSPPVLPEVGFVRLPLLLRVFPISKSKLYAGIAAGEYPAPVRLGKRTSAWRVQDVRALIARLSSGQGD